MSNSIVEQINHSGWADWSMDKLEIDYDQILITISNNMGAVVTIGCTDYIGYCFIGHQQVKKLYGENPLLGGGSKRLDDCWYQLNIHLIDGNIVQVVCKDFAVHDH